MLMYELESAWPTCMTEQLSYVKCLRSDTEDIVPCSLEWLSSNDDAHLVQLNSFTLCIVFYFRVIRTGDIGKMVEGSFLKITGR